MMVNFLLAHLGAVAAVSAYVFLALVSALPDPGDPRPLSEKLYDAFYTALHVLANRVIVKYPQTSNLGGKQ
jgi:hypothetical protein